MKRKSTADEKIFTLPMPFDEAIERFARVNTKEREEEPVPEGVAVPFVKWVGGKRAIIENLVELLPAEFSDYYEPCAGGAALFFEIYPREGKAHISDSNLDLMITYKVIQDDPESLITKLEEHAKKDSDDYYYKIRKRHDVKDPIARAARFIYLNKTCYNGLYRVNKKGEFNVPRGRYVNPDISQRENIKACNKVLQGVEIKYQEFDKINPVRGDLVYFDPPYHPASDNGFTKYTQLDFSEKDQERLRDFALKLHRKGVKLMLSNSDTPYIRSLYTTTLWNVKVVEAPRNVNCKSEGRTAVNELVIRNYDNQTGRNTG